MQRRIGTEAEISKTVSPLDSIGASLAIDRTASYYLNAGEKVQKIRKLRYIHGTIELVFQGMIKDIDTKEQPAHSLYRDMENLDFQIMLTNCYYTNPNSMHIYFPMKIKKKKQQRQRYRLSPYNVNNFFPHFVKERSVTRYGYNKQLIPILRFYVKTST